MLIEYIPIEKFMEVKDSGIYKNERIYKVHPEDFQLHCNKCNWRKRTDYFGNVLRYRENITLILDYTLKRGYIEATSPYIAWDKPQKVDASDSVFFSREYNSYITSPPTGYSTDTTIVNRVSRPIRYRFTRNTSSNTIEIERVE